MIFENIVVDCSHIDNYRNNEHFKFLPGHKILLLNFSQSQAQTNTNSNTNQIFQHPSFSILLQNLIQTALNNYEKSSSNNRYPEILFDFAIYIYIMAGKRCYEVIAANLPIPSATTICNNIVIYWTRFWKHSGTYYCTKTFLFFSKAHSKRQTACFGRRTKIETVGKILGGYQFSKIRLFIGRCFWSCTKSCIWCLHKSVGGVGFAFEWD